MSSKRKSCRICQGFGIVADPAPPHNARCCPTCGGIGREPKAPRSDGSEHMAEPRG